MNEELVRHFQSVAPVDGLMPDVEFMKIQQALNSHFNGMWTWELVAETTITIANATNVMTTVALYVPGRVYTGRSLCKATDYAYNHLRALYDASLAFIDKSNSGVNPAPHNDTGMQSQNMSVDQIAALMAGNGTFVNNKADMTNYPNQDGTPADRVSFDAISDNGHAETELKPEPPQEQPQEQSPQHNNNGWTEQMITDINEFKATYKIQNDEQFNRWVSMWHPGWTKKNLTPDNIYNFINDTNNMGKF